MSNFSLNFSHPWLLFLLIPAVVLLVVGIMRVPRRYRNTRNRVVAVVLEAIVYFCVILVLSGLTFTYTTGNAENEIILLVDVTDTMDACADTRDRYVQEILYEGESDGCRMGVVTFGFTQVYAAPLSSDADEVYRQYKSAALPDTTATDISSALEYTAKLFTTPETSKIVIVSDGKETDQNALSSLSLVTSQGTVVESVYIPSPYEGDDIQIVGVDVPAYHIDTGDYFDVALTIQSNYEGTVSLHVTDNGEDMLLYDTNNSVEDGGREIKEGTNTVTFRTQVFDKYLHAIRITLEDVDEEVLTQNNSYCVYIYIDNYNKILIFEHSAGEAKELEEALQTKDGGNEPGEEGPYRITTITLAENCFGDLPLTVNELRQYDLVILENTSNSDMYDAYRYYIEDELDAMGSYYSYFYTNSGNPKSGGGLLPQLLYSYVYDYGGGLLTVGGVTEGDDGEYVANMYSRSDMYGSILQQMIPVTAINYTPPTGIVVVIDTSGSMGSGDGSLLSYAILGVLQSLDLLSVRDYIGVIEFSSNPHIVVNIQSLTYKSDIQAALNDLLENPQSQGTVLYSSFDAAITMLEGDSRFERKHIIFVTDGLLSDTEACYPLAEKCRDVGITVTSVVVGGGDTGLENMRQICYRADGEENVSSVQGEEKYLYDCSSGGRQSDVGTCIFNDVQAIVWEEINYVTTQIQVDSSYIFSSLLDGLFATVEDESGEYVTDRGHLDASLTRFYGTTIKTGADLILTGDYSVPIYAQWSYGAGMVGSYMGDLSHYGDSSGEIIFDSESGAGIQFIINAVDNLMPTQDIRPNGISVSLTEDNYTNRVNVYADVLTGYTVDAKIYAREGEYAGTDWVLDLNTVTSGDTDEMDAYVTVAMNASNNYSRANFIIKVSGVYEIVVTLYDENGNVVVNEMGTDATATLYKRISYSAEYDTYGEDDGLALMNSLSTGDYGGAITDADELFYVYSGLVTRLTKTVDPRLPLIIVALVLFLLDIAVRKFKWKWPHEIVRDRRIKKENMKKSWNGADSTS
ncbi:MAG: VWA domain-containing protein [Bacteroidales bacterium]|nr:VWA domain-containing protein [Bacteroidales bacterium]